ncbi:MAG: hypothetical protein ACRETN_08945 [Nevskiales bacterium]
MQPISRAEFERLIAGAEILERQGGGLSALRTPDGRIIKLWQRRRGLSSDRIWPYSRRFADNCRRLLRRGIAAPRIEQAYRLDETGEHVLIYPLLAGTPLRQLAERSALPLAELADFYAALHAKGVLFRSIHLGNVIKLDRGSFALIDVTDVRFFRRSLPVDKRAQNLGYAWTYRGDKSYFTPAATDQLVRDYLARAHLNDKEEATFHRRLKHHRRHYETRNRRA